MKRLVRNLADRIKSASQNFNKGMRLRHTILLSVFISILLTETFVIVGNYALWKRDEIGKLDQEALLMLKANISSTSFLSVQETLEMGRRITGISVVRGGTVYTRMGEQIASFGAPPVLSMLTFQREHIRRLTSINETYLDIFYPPEITGLANPVVLRIDTSGISYLLKQRLLEKGITTLSVAFLSSIVIVFLLSYSVINPILQLRNAVLNAMDHPSATEGLRLSWKRGDEFGEIAKALDMLFLNISIDNHEDLMAVKESLKQSAFAVLTYDQNWRLTNANEAALNLFGAKTQQDIAERNENYIRHKSDTGIKDLSPRYFIQNENIMRPVNIVTPWGLKRCFMNAIIVRKRANTVSRIVITFVDITQLVRHAEALKKKNIELSGDKADLAHRVHEMRALFQNCLTLLSASKQMQSNANEAMAQEPNTAEPIKTTA